MEQLTADQFYEQVIKASYDYPVVVQFWAPWCGPCHGLTSTLERIESTNQYLVKFVGLDVDQYTDLALQHQVMGVPHTKVFVSGFPIDEFSDPLPEHEIELFLKNAILLPGILRHSHFPEAINEEYVQDLEKDGVKSTRKNVYDLTLAKHYFFIDSEKSKHYLSQIPDESDQFEDRLFIQSLYALMEVEFSSDPVHKKLWAAKNSLNRRNFESTYQFLLQANLINSGQSDDFPKSALLAFRNFLGPNHELNRKYQSQFSSILDS